LAHAVPVKSREADRLGMPRKETPETRGDKTSKTPMEVGDRGQNRPAAPETNAQKVDEAATRDDAVQERR
jgi:hypothetical protein